MPNQKKGFPKQKTPPLKEQVAKIAAGVVKIQETMATLATKQELQKEMAEVKHRLVHVEEQATQNELGLGRVEKKIDDIEASLKKDINDLNESIVQKFIEIHGEVHTNIENRLKKLEETPA